MLIVSLTGYGLSSIIRDSLIGFRLHLCLLLALHLLTESEWIKLRRIYLLHLLKGDLRSCLTFEFEFSAEIHTLGPGQGNSIKFVYKLKLCFSFGGVFVSNF